MTYQDAKAEQDVLYAAMEAAAKPLKAYPKTEIGLTPDHAKTDQWRADRMAYRIAFNRLRDFNAVFVKRFKKEIREERRQRRAA